MHDPRATALLEALPEEERFASWHLAIPGRTPVGQGRGAIEVLHAMTPTRAVSRALALVPGLVLDSIYVVLARNRAHLGRLVPDQPGPVRFP